MCFTSDQHPPEPPRSSEVGHHGPLVLTAADGNRFSAFEAVPVTPRGASLVLMPDIRGMHSFYTDLALCFAQTLVALQRLLDLAALLLQSRHHLTHLGLAVRVEEVVLLATGIDDLDAVQRRHRS